MYLDKPMRDHVLLQAIARVNRPYEDDDGRRKPSGFVLDFVGIFEKLEKALAFDSQDVTGVIQGIEVLQARFAELVETARQEYLPVLDCGGKPGATPLSERRAKGKAPSPLRRSEERRVGKEGRS